MKSTSIMMEKPRFKKTHPKKRTKNQAFLMYFPYAEALIPFQPAGLKRRGPGAMYGPKGIATRQHSRFVSKDSFYSDSDSDEDQQFSPSPVNLSSNLRPILYEDDVQLMERVELSQMSSGLPSYTNCSRSSSFHDSDSPKRRPVEEQMTTYSQFLVRSPQRVSKAFRRTQADEDCQEDAWDKKVRLSVTPLRALSAPKTEIQGFGSQLKLPNVRREGLVVVPESNTQSTPALAVPVPPPHPPSESQLCESESVSLLPDKPRTSKIRVRKHKPARAHTKSPRPKTSSQVPERRAMTAAIMPPIESRVRPGPPAVADKTDSQHREVMVDVLLRNKTSQDHATMMLEYLKRSGLAETTRVFILNSQDEYVRRALKRRNWVENKVGTSSAFHLKWTYTDSEMDYRTLRPGQMFNHFSNNRKLTTKCGLTSSFRSTTLFKVNPDSFYPRTYDLGDTSQLEEFKTDFERTSVFNIVKSHSEYFQSVPIDQACNTVVNRLCMKNALRYCAQLISDFESMCEHASKYVFVPDTRKAFTCPREDWRHLMEYSRLHLPFTTLPDDTKLRCSRKSDVGKVWTKAGRKVVERCTEMSRKIGCTWVQTGMEGTRNVWIVKPGQNARGSGVHCSDDLQEILDCGSKLQARIVQKYIERPLLLSLPKGEIKFDIRQWVLVTSIDPLEVYFFSSCYIRLCTQPFTLDDLKDKFSHLANYSVQKAQAKAPEETAWNLEQFLQYLKEKRPEVEWRRDVEPLIHALITQTLQCVSDDLDPRPGSFELYGFDVILDDSLRPWLLEVNLSPACSERTPWISSLLDCMADGLLSIVLDGNKGSTGDKAWVAIHRGDSVNAEYREQPACSLEIVGEKVNLRKEKQLDRRFVTEQAAGLIQRVARGFIVRTRNRHQRRKRAAVRIQTCVRGYFARRQLAELRETAAVLVVQTTIRRSFAVEVMVLRRKTRVVTKMQALYRRWKAKETVANMREIHSAENIQKAWRRMLSQWQLNSAKEYVRKVTQIQHVWRRRFLSVTHSAVRIQSRWRGIIGRNTAGNQRKYFAFMLSFQSIVRTVLCTKRLSEAKATKAASSVQSVYRRFLAKQEFTLRKETKSVIFIQRWYKSYKSRKIFLRLRRAKVARIRAAIRIQAAVKGFYTRVDFAARRTAAAAIVIQTAYRGFLCRHYVTVLSKRYRAAVQIQRRFRGYYCRKRYQMLKRIRAQEKERTRRKELLRKEKQARVVSTSDRLSQRTSELVVSRLSPAPIETAIVRTVSTVGSMQRELKRRLSARPGEGKRGSKGEVSPQGLREGMVFEGIELLPRPGKAKMRVKTALQGEKRGVR